MSESQYKVLCVDDEPRVLEALQRQLRGRYEVLTATSGAQALDVIRQHKDLAIVVSDMRMPEMDGATLLRHARLVRPSAVRVLLTGQADMAAAIKAINEGQIFRFLTKPCAPEQFTSVLEEAIRQHELIAAERVLLQRTLVGTIKALTEIMALMSPSVVGRSQRLKRRVSSLATHLNLEDRWQLEVAAMLSYLGHVSLPDSITYKLYRGRDLEPFEQQRLGDATLAADRLIGHVPRLAPVSALLRALHAEDEEIDLPEETVDPMQMAILRLALEVERMESQGLGRQAILDTLQTSVDFPSELLQALREVMTEQQTVFARAEVPVTGLTIGMVLDEDIKTVREVLIAPRGCEVTASFMEHIRHFVKQLHKPTVCVLLDEALLGTEPGSGETLVAEAS